MVILIFLYNVSKKCDVNEILRNDGIEMQDADNEPYFLLLKGVFLFFPAGNL